MFAGSSVPVVNDVAAPPFYALFRVICHRAGSIASDPESFGETGYKNQKTRAFHRFHGSRPALTHPRPRPTGTPLPFLSRLNAFFKTLPSSLLPRLSNSEETESHATRAV